MGSVFLCLLLALISSFYLSKSSWPQKHPLIFLFSLSFMVVMPLWGEPEVILDASRYFMQAKQMELHGIGYFMREWGKEIWVWTDLPTVPFFYGIIFQQFGEQRLAVQLFNSFLFSFTVVTTYLIGKKLWNDQTGFWAGLFLLGIPYLPTQVPLLLVDVPAMFLFTFCVFSFLMALEKGGAWIGVASLFVFLALFAKYSIWPMLLIMPLITLVYFNKGSNAPLVRLAAVMLVAGILSGALFYLKHDVFLSQIKLLLSFQLPGLGRWRESFISTFFFQTHPFITAFAAYGVYLAVKRRDRRFLVAAWFLIFVLLFQVERIRYIIPLFPLFTLMASYGLGGIDDYRVRKFTGYAAVASSILILLFAYLPFLNGLSPANIQNAGRYLNGLECEGVEVYAMPQSHSMGSTAAAVPILDYFTDKKIVAAPVRQSRTEAPTKAPEERLKSSLRFTWGIDYRKFYEADGKYGNMALAVISSERFQKPPPELLGKRNSNEIPKEFALSSGIFRYKTFVVIFDGDCG